MVIQNPCGICKRSVHGNHRYVHCAICHLRIHIGCNFIPVHIYEEFKTQRENTELPDNEKKIFHCNTCLNDALPFGKECNNIFYSTNSLGLNHDSNLENLEITLDKTTTKTN